MAAAQASARLKRAQTIEPVKISAAAPARIVGRLCAAAVLVLVGAALAASIASGAPQNVDRNSQVDARMLESRSLAIGQGIVVPKRTALIAGLNQQFKLPASNGSLVPSVLSHWPLSRLQPRRPGSAPVSQQPQNQAPPPAIGQQQQQQQQQGLYLDRHQQEILAANPNLLNPSSLPSALLTRSAAADHAQLFHQQLAPRGAQMNDSTTTTGQQRQISSGADESGQQQQLYRGYSLIELDVKSEADRRFVQDLYGNLSAALDEQAQNPNAISVSPYVDVDFWSFRQALNDQIDIMVSPKSRSFILGQLNRAKIRHRIKIDDIQARLDQQQPSESAQQQSAASAKRAPASDSLSGRAGHHQHQHHHHHHHQQQDSTLNGRQSSGGGRPMNDSQFFDNYQRLADMTQWLESLVERNRDIGQIKVIGRSSQGRYLRVLKLGYEQHDDGGGASSSGLLNVADLMDPSAGRSQPSSVSAPPAGNASAILESFFRKQAASKKLGSIWLDGGTHAREWISPSTVLYIAFRLADNHNRCSHFFDSLRAAVQALEQQQQQQQAGRARRARRASSAGGQLDAALVNGINEINSSLLGGRPLKPTRPRTELEHTLELLAKSPQEVASEHGCDLEMEQLLRRYTFFVMPVLNPDGYEYSHTHNRLWRKTRSTSNHPIYRHFCLGADPNRNYDARHGAAGSSTHPCSQTFAGSVPFTEPETRHHSNFVYANRLGMKMYISFHSYSQMILLPYSHSKQLAPDHKDLESVGLAAAKAIEQTHGTVYRVGPSASILYTASGTASDWAYEKAGIKYSYTMELRDTGTYGFLLPRQQIVPTGEETFNGLLAMINQMEKNDNLLTSKSSLGAQLRANSSSESSAPDGPTSWETRLRSRPPLAQLESVLDSSHRRQPFPAETAAATADQTVPSYLPGARDRIRPASGAESWLLGADFDGQSGGRSQQSRGGVSNAATGAESSLAAYGEEEIIDSTSDNEPDAGYAFEGEGELMEPTNQADSSADLHLSAGQSADNHLVAEQGGRQRSLRAPAENRQLRSRADQSRRIAQLAGLSAATGRSYINNGRLQDGGAPSSQMWPRRRESSEDLGRAATVARRL